MRPGLINLLWALAGAAVLGLIMFLAFHFQSTQTPNEQLAIKVKLLDLAGQFRLALASAVEAEKSAVLAPTEAESKSFADQARAATATAEETRKALEELLHTRGTPKENELLGQASQAFSEFKRVDDELLDLAIKNTNLKASALAFGPAADAIEEMDGALSRLLGKNTKKEILLAAAGAQAAALRIQAVLPEHIAEESDAKMDQLESRMTTEDEEVRKDLKALAALLPADADAQLASSRYARFAELRTQILKLSRENTNVRSLSISRNRKRKVTVLCQDAMAALEKAIEDAPVPGAPARPR